MCNCNYHNNTFFDFAMKVKAIKNTVFWRSISAAILLLLPQLAFSAEPLRSVDFTSPPTDLSIIFLRNIFGAVGGGLAGPTVNVIGQIFYVFNCGILVLAGIFLIYTTVRSIVELANANTGQMGEKFSWWQPIRIVLGIGLLVPKTTGYSTLNTIIIWVVLQGVGLANQIWHRAVYYMAEGGVLYSPPAVPFNSSGLPVGSTTIDKTLIAGTTRELVGSFMTAEDLVRSEVCMNTLYDVLKKSRETRLQELLESDKKSYQLLKNYNLPVFHETYEIDRVKNIYRVVFPGNTQNLFASFQPPNLTPMNLMLLIAKIGIRTGCKDSNEAFKSSLNGICGVYSWGLVPSGKGAENYRQSKELGLRYMVSGVGYMSARSVSSYPMEFGSTGNPFFKSTTDFPSDFHERAANDLVNAAAMYQATIYKSRLEAESLYNPDNIADEYYYTKELQGFFSIKQANRIGDGYNVIKDLTSGGWINAGSSYFTIAKVITAKELNASKFFGSGILVTGDSPHCDTAGYSESCGFVTDIIRGYLTGDNQKEYINFLNDRLRWNIKTDTGTTNLYSKALTLADELNIKLTPQGADDVKKLPFYRYVKGSTRVASGGVQSGQVDERVTGAVNTPTSGRARNAQNVFRAAYTIFFYPLTDMLNEIFDKWFDLFIKAPEKTIAEEKGVNVYFPLLKTKQLGDLIVERFFDFWLGVLQACSDALVAYYASLYTPFVLAAGVVGGAALTVGGFLVPVFGVFVVLAGIATMLASIAGIVAAPVVMTYLRETLRIFFEIPLMVGLPISAIVTGTMLVNGIMLAYYIPLLPFMLFTFGVISWLIFVIEAMVAAPLVALGMTHPEGQHNLLGKSEPAMMMLLAIFVRPSAMIIGLLISLVLSYVALDVLNAGFGRIMSAAFTYGKAADPTDPVYHIKHIAMILLYTFIVIALMKQCFSLIHGLPSYIMDWIGVRTREGMEAHLVEGVQQQISQVAEKVASGMAEAAKGAHPSMQFEAASASAKATTELGEKAISGGIAVVSAIPAGAGAVVGLVGLL